MVSALEELVFRHRAAILLALALFTAVMGHFALQLRMDAGFAKQLPSDHEYVQTLFEYQDQLIGADLLIIVLRAREGEIWNQPFLARLQSLTDDVFFLPGVDRRTVTSLWTPNTRYFEITEEGMEADDVIPSSVLPDSMSADDVALVRKHVIQGGYVGRLVASDYSAAMVTAALLDVDPGTGRRLDYLELASRLEETIRAKHVDAAHDVHILGFSKLVGEIADGAKGVVQFFVVAFLLTAAAVYAYARSWILTAVPLFCSLVSVVWQFGTLHVLGFGLDPLAILVPFLVFAIGVSHGVQQINLISKEICGGADSVTAARRSFSGLLVPGSMALITDLVGFGTLVLISIPMIQELGITALIGVGFKIVTNLFMLPIVVSYLDFDRGYEQRILRARANRERLLRRLGAIAEPRNAFVAVILFSVLFATAVSESRGRHVGDLQPGAPELRPQARYNVDAAAVVERFTLGLDVLTVMVETPPDSCIDYDTMEHLGRFSWHMRNVPGVQAVFSSALIARTVNAGWNEGNLKWTELPRNRYALVRSVGLLPESSGLVNADCTLMPVHVFTEDHRAETIKAAIAAVHTFRDQEPRQDVRIRLGGGNIGVQAAINEELEQSELPMMLYVYTAIIALVLLTHRDWRATVCCCVPLGLATFLGYWFMKELHIGLKVATMPVMVLAVGLGVDYAFYIYDRLQRHLAEGLDTTTAYQQTLFETGNAVIFTAVTLAIGVSTWSFSALKFQADMGILLTFMFLVNMLMAVTLLPALAVVIDELIPRRRRGPEAGVEGGRSLRSRVGIGMLALALLTGGEARAAESPRDLALGSPLATRSLLLGAARPGERLVAVGEWGHVVLSDDGGASWRQATSVPTRATLTDVIFVDAEHGWAVGHDALILHTRDGGETWTIQHRAPAEETPLLSVWFENRQHGIAVGGFGLMLETRDGGSSWERRAPTRGLEQDHHLNEIFPGPGDSLFVAAESGKVFRSRDGGGSWEPLTSPYQGSFWGGLALDGEGILVFGMRGHAFRSEDLGETWLAVESDTEQSLQGATRLRDGRLVLVGLGGTVAISRNGGRTFSATTQADRRGIASVIEGRDGRLLLFGETGFQTRGVPAADPAP